MSDLENNYQSLISLLQNAPKKINTDYLRQLQSVLKTQTVEKIEDIEDIANSLLLLVLSTDTSHSDKNLAISILNLIPPVPGLSEILLPTSISQLIGAIPVLFTKCMPPDEITTVIKKISWSLCHENLTVEEKRSVLMFLAKIVYSDSNCLSRDEIKEVLDILPNWIRQVISPQTNKTSRFQWSSSSLSLTDSVDENRDLFVMLNHSSLSSSDQMLDIQVFSMLRTWLLDPNRNSQLGGKVSPPLLADLISEELSFIVQDYCLRMVDQANKSTYIYLLLPLYVYLHVLTLSLPIMLPLDEMPSE